jgi:thymidylate synthase
MAEEALVRENTPGDLIPRPDPTLLTATAVTQAKDDLRRELQSQRELLSERISRLEAIIHDLDERLKDDVNGSVGALQKLFGQRITGLEVIMKMLDEALKNAPSDRDALRERLQTDIQIAVDNLRRLHEERFTAIQQQFTERDTRTDQEKKSSKEALDAALLAQKESVSQQNDANTTAATKSETSFTKQIDQIGTLIATLEKSLTDRITELKERIDRGEGQGAGAAGERTERRLDLGSNYTAGALLLGFLVLAITLYAALHH